MTKKLVLRRLAIEVPELESVNFSAIIDIFKQSNRLTTLQNLNSWVYWYKTSKTLTIN